MMTEVDAFKSIVHLFPGTTLVPVAQYDRATRQVIRSQQALSKSARLAQAETPQP